MDILNYDDRGAGEAVLFIAGRGGLGRTWHVHHAPVFLVSGYRVITFDNRGVGATADDSGFTVDTMVADTAALIEELDAAPVRVIGASMGAYIAQELMLARPDLVSHGVLMGSTGRPERERKVDADADAEQQPIAADLTLPPRVDVSLRLLSSLSPKTLNDDKAASEWVALFSMVAQNPTPGMLCQIGMMPTSDRLDAYRAITAPTLVVAFADDIVVPPSLAAELADALPKGRYLQIDDAGHLGFLERPHIVNAAILSFFSDRD